MGGDRHSRTHTSGRSSRMYSQQSQADSAGGPAVPKHESSRRHSTKDPPTADEVKHQSRRGMDPSVSSIKHGDESTIESLRRDPTKEVSSKSKCRRVSSRSVMDPPYQNRGADPSEAFAPVESGNTAIQRAMNAHRKRSGNRRKASGSFKNTELAKEPVLRNSTASTSRRTSSTVTSKSSKKPKKEVKIQGILKKKTATPPPIAYFGGTVISSSSSSDNEDSSSESESDAESTKERDNDEKSLNSIKSGMRRGKYAAANETALSVTHRSNDSDDSSIESNESDGFEFDETSSSDKFVREHSHFLRTADLGMTQGK